LKAVVLEGVKEPLLGLVKKQIDENLQKSRIQNNDIEIDEPFTLSEIQDSLWHYHWIHIEEPEKIPNNIKQQVQSTNNESTWIKLLAPYSEKALNEEFIEDYLQLRSMEIDDDMRIDDVYTNELLNANHEERMILLGERATIDWNDLQANHIDTLYEIKTPDRTGIKRQIIRATNRKEIVAILEQAQQLKNIEFEEEEEEQAFMDAMRL
jgi:hypothetical protein